MEVGTGQVDDGTVALDFYCRNEGFEHIGEQGLESAPGRTEKGKAAMSKTVRELRAEWQAAWEVAVAAKTATDAVLLEALNATVAAWEAYQAALKKEQL